MALLMGYAIQHGATCVVAAVEETIMRGSFKRLSSFIEASLWVLSGLIILRAFNVMTPQPFGYPLSLATIVGGTLLGFGAYVNRACVFGTIARFGSGEFAYIMTPVGFLLGCFAFDRLIGHIAPPLVNISPVLQLPMWLAYVAGFLLLLRLGVIWHRQGWKWNLAILAKKIWAPHAATIVIGLAFLPLFILAGNWAYTNVLEDIASGNVMQIFSRIFLMLALFAGALWGGRQAGISLSASFPLPLAVRCLVGGALMGIGSMAIPGSNDALILLGMPLLWPYAWVAFAAMCVSIAIPLYLQKSS